MTDGSATLSARCPPSASSWRWAGAPDGAYERLYALFVPLIIGGHETTGHTLSWTFYEMARRPADRTRGAGRDPGLPRRSPGAVPLTTADYDERPVSWALLAEVLRRHPPVQSVARTTPRDGVVPPGPGHRHRRASDAPRGP